MKKRIVIVGAGYSGTLTTKKLEKELGSADVEITLIDKNPFHTMLTELHEVAAGRIEESGIRLDLKKIFAGRNVNVVLDTVVEIDFQKQCVMGQKQTYDYDYIVISSGSRPNYFGISGAEKYTYSLWSYDAAVRLNERIKFVFHKAQSLTNEEDRKKMLSFWVIGAGFSGVEMISELAEYIPILCEKYEVEESDVTLNIVDGLGRVIPNVTENLSAKAEKKLKRMGIQVLLNTKVDSISEDFISLKVGEEVRSYTAGTVVWTAGTQSEVITQQAAEVLDSTRGRIKVDPYLRSDTDKKVYIVGDNMFYVLPGQECAVPQMVENCEQSAHIAALNMITEITGKGEMKEYKPSFHGVMVSIGSKDGVARVGIPGHLFCLSGFLAIAAKHFINIIYFLQVLGWNKIAHYLKDEFFTIRNRRSCVGGHLSNRTPSFLLVPLRVWLGISWLVAGLNGTETIFGLAHSSTASVVESIIGLFLIGGFFTSFAAIVSFIMFFIVAEITIGNVWVIFASIVAMNGAGKIFGMDYYVMPALKKRWKKLPLVRKWYLYED